ncbi:MAG: 30S ribosomal protein S1 [Phycisphaerae bacterium]|nr:30S ribosomal protein S1 [Phycisphaerae bacterium]
MVDRNLINSLEIDESTIEAELKAALEGVQATDDTMDGLVAHATASFEAGNILPGRIVGLAGNDVVVDVGLKSEGVIPADEFNSPDEIVPGKKIEVLLESIESEGGQIQLSKRKADRIRSWQRIIEVNKEGDTVSGTVMRKIKGGLLVDIGVPVFLPASQVDIRRPGDIAEYIGKKIDAVILKIDEERRNIVISRRKLIEERRAKAKDELLKTLEVGQSRKGVVKNIADFGAFVDLGGIDGLLHITDMSWGRINHPSEVVRIDQELEVQILNIDREKEKIALGLKQLNASPWENIRVKYPVNARVKGSVVNIMSYGAFVKLEEGVEGLVHISEMSWTRRINHPSEVLNVADTIDVVVLEIDEEKQEISLGMKQTEVNPWMLVAEKYPPNTVVEGTVRNLTNYGAFVEIEEGIDGLLHVSDLSWTKKIGHPNELLKKGQKVRCVVLSVDQEKQRIALGFKQLTEDPWLRAVPEHYIPGQIVRGKVTKITNFGVFVELEDDLEGLLHISELADHKVEDPTSVVQVGQEIEVKILRVDTDDRKIGLSLKRAQWASESTGGGAEGGAAAGQPARRRGGLFGPGEQTTDIIDHVLFQQPPKNVEPAAPAESTEPAEPAEPQAEPTEPPPAEKKEQE